MRRGFGWLLVVVLVLGACGGGDGGAVTEESGGTGAGATTGAGPESPDDPAGWLSLLAAVPDRTGNRTYVIANDYAAARDLLGITAPSSGASEDVLVDYTMTIAMGPPASDGRDPMLDLAAHAVFGQRAMTAPLEWKAEFGFTIADLDRDLIAGTPPAETLLFEGSFDPTAIEAVLQADPVWGPKLEVVDFGDGSYFRWGGDFEMDIEGTSAARPLGRGGCLAVSDDVVHRTYGCEVIEAALEARSGSIPTLADLPGAAALAGALDAAGVYSVHFVFDVSPYNLTVNPLDVVTGEADPFVGEWLGPYLAFATGAGLDADRQPIAVFALAHVDADAAVENAARMERMLADGVSIQSGGRPWTDLVSSYEVAVSGTTVVATLWTDGPPRLWVRVPFMRDSLLLWEP